jgi:uncharacterized ion transporter superfamily protein YfcC
MDILEVILLIVGIVIFIGSFLLPAGRSDAGRIDTDAAKQEIHGLIEEEMKTVRAQVQDKVEETSEDVRSHLRVPSSGLMSEMNTCFK